MPGNANLRQSAWLCRALFLRLKCLGLLLLCHKGRAAA